MDQAQRQDNEERRQRAEEAFERVWRDWKTWSYAYKSTESDWASEMGVTSLYKRLKDGK
jgi:hypothetical protein